MVAQTWDYIFREHESAILVAFGLTDDQHVPVEIHVLDAQAQRLQQAHAGAVHHFGHQSRDSLHMFQKSGGFMALAACVLTVSMASLSRASRCRASSSVKAGSFSQLSVHSAAAGSSHRAGCR